MGQIYKVIDLFAGAGGMTLGFVRQGFDPILAIEKEPDFAQTYAANFGAHVIVQDIADIVDAGGVQLKADVVIGGPPCQGFSNLTGNKANDPRRSLWRFYMDVVVSSDCKVFVVENVPNLLTSVEGQAIIKHAKNLGFHVTSGKLLASEFGVPQNRRRAIIIGSKLGPVDLPKPNGNKMTVKQAFKGIPLKAKFTDAMKQPSQGKDLHVARNPTQISMQRYMLIPEGGNRFDLERLAPELTPGCWLRKREGGTDLFGRLEWNGPARCTIRCEFFKPEKGRYLHPSEHRPITHWEAARLQTFPDDFKWYGTKTRIAAQIGNAVPPVFAEALAKHVRAHLEEYEAKAVKKPSVKQLKAFSPLLLQAVAGSS